MATVWINPQKALMPEADRKKWIALMSKHHPDTDWAAEMEKIKPANVKRTGRKGKED